MLAMRMTCLVKPRAHQPVGIAKNETQRDGDGRGEAGQQQRMADRLEIGERHRIMRAADAAKLNSTRAGTTKPMRMGTRQTMTASGALPAIEPDAVGLARAL